MESKCAVCKRRNVSVLRRTCRVCEALWRAIGTEAPMFLGKLTDAEKVGMSKEEKERYDYIKSGKQLKTFFSYKNLTEDDLIQDKK